MAISSVIYTKVGQARGALRIWIEGRQLSAQGVNPGDRFTVVTETQRIRMVFSPDGTHTVSRRVKGEQVLPIIDIASQKLAQAFRENDRVRVVVKDGCIEVTLHHQERARQSREARVQKAINDAQPITIGSIAHGGGVLDHALHEGLSAAGVSHKLAFANEIEPEYLQASMSNNPVWSDGAMAVQGPMQEVEWHLLPKVDLLVAGLPCTGASLSGRAKNKLKAAEEHEGAGALFVHFLQAIQVLRPSVVLLENVPQYQTTTSMTVIRAVLQQLDYTVQETVLNGADFGALEHRSRMVMIASSSGLNFPSIDSLRGTDQRTRRLGEVLEPVPDDDESWRSYSYLAEKEVRDKEAGKGFRRQLVTPFSTSVGTIGRGYAKARSTEPFVEHPSGDGRSRLLTPVEHARVKTIPELLVRGCSSTTAHEILGQSIIHAVFKSVGMWIGEALKQACNPAVNANPACISA